MSAKTIELIVESIRAYLLNTNVQLGATYKTSQVSTNAYTEAYKVAAGFINAQPEEVSALSSLASQSY